MRACVVVTTRILKSVNDKCCHGRWSFLPHLDDGVLRFIHPNARAVRPSCETEFTRFHMAQQSASWRCDAASLTETINSLNALRQHVTPQPASSRDNSPRYCATWLPSVDSAPPLGSLGETGVERFRVRRFYPD